MAVKTRFCSYLACKKSVVIWTPCPSLLLTLRHSLLGLSVIIILTSTRSMQAKSMSPKIQVTLLGISGIYWAFQETSRSEELLALRESWNLTNGSILIPNLTTLSLLPAILSGSVLTSDSSLTAIGLHPPHCFFWLNFSTHKAISSKISNGGVISFTVSRVANGGTHAYKIEEDTISEVYKGFDKWSPWREFSTLSLLIPARRK